MPCRTKKLALALVKPSFIPWLYSKVPCSKQGKPPFLRQWHVSCVELQYE